MSQRNRAMQSQLRLMHAVQDNTEFGYRDAPQLFGPSLHSLPPFPPSNPQNSSLSNTTSPSPPPPPPGYPIQSSFNPHGNTRGNTNVSTGILCGLGLPESQPSTQGQGIDGSLSVFADYTRQQYDKDSQNNASMSGIAVGSLPSVNSRNEIYSMRDQSPMSLSHLDQMNSHQVSISSSSGDRYSNPANAVNDLNIFVSNQSTSSELNLAMSSHSFVDDASNVRTTHSTSESIIITSPSLFHSPTIIGEPRTAVTLGEEEFTPSQLQQQQLRQVLMSASLPSSHFF